LGADRVKVLQFVVRSAFRLILVGMVIGLPLSVAVGRLLGNQLYGTNPYNPVVILTAVVVLGFSAFVASFIPALRASMISPWKALRTE
jgi:ABC-type antimicrobial peptide transport system permease subunit